MRLYYAYYDKLRQAQFIFANQKSFWESIDWCLKNYEDLNTITDIKVLDDDDIKQLKKQLGKEPIINY